MTNFVLKNIGVRPDPYRALANYRELAGNYDATCTRIESLRQRAVHALQLQPGETVFDIACGTGPTLPLLAAKVSPTGSVVGVEMSPEMAEQARQRITAMALGAQVAVAETPVHQFAPAGPADAVLLCYAHDVLQCAPSLDRLIAACKPGARVAITGMKTLPWLWGWPVNAFNLFRARRYLTTYANMDCPWRLLASRGADLQLVQTGLWGSAYVVVGTLPLKALVKEAS
jgi:SAM-dependent methyltransferase